jgi:hypothetical protein
MGSQTVKLLIAAVLLLHGLGHGGAFVAALLARGGRADTGAWGAARLWALPSLSTSAATIVAGVFWTLSLVGFVVTALAFWGWLMPPAIWRQLAIASAIVSLVGIVLFLGTWPAFNTLAALAVNLAVLITQLWTHWPDHAVFGT